MALLAACFGIFWHGHHLDHESRPSGEMLRPLTLACLRTILLPREAGLFPGIVYGINEIFAKLSVHVLRFGLLRTWLLGNILRRHTLADLLFAIAPFGRWITYQKIIENKIVHIHPNRTTPVVLFGAIERIPHTQATYPVLRPQFGLVRD